MKSINSRKITLLASGVSAALLITVMNTNAQNVSITGSNSTVTNPCWTTSQSTPIVSVPETCGTLVVTPGIVFDGPSYSRSYNSQEG